MKFWNDDLRICRKCKKPCELRGEAEANCPHCGATVWFFNYKPIPEPPSIPVLDTIPWWNAPTGRVLLGVVGFWGIVALAAIASNSVVAVACVFSCIGFGIFGVVRHREATMLEDRVEHEQQVLEYGKIQAARVKELTLRYQNLLLTGDERIEHYYR